MTDSQAVPPSANNKRLTDSLISTLRPSNLRSGEEGHCSLAKVYYWQLRPDVHNALAMIREWDKNSGLPDLECQRVRHQR